MKRRIAVFGNGWCDEYLKLSFRGLSQSCREHNADFFAFINLASYTEHTESDPGPFNIFRLPDLSKFDGLIIYSNIINCAEEVERIRTEAVRLGIPTVSLEMELPDVDYIGTDNLSGMRALVEHMAHVHNVRRVWFMNGPAKVQDAIDRLAVTEEVLQSVGGCVERVFNCDWSYQQAFSHIEEVAQEADVKWPEAIICANDNMAVGTCAKLKELGIKVPEEVKVTGYDHIGMGRIFFPAISSVERSWDTIGYEGGNHLFAMLDGENPPHKVMLPTSFAEEESCGCGYKMENMHARMDYCREGLCKENENVVFEWFINDISELMYNSESAHFENGKLSEYFAKYQQYVGSDFYLMLEDTFIKSVYNNEVTFKKMGYSETLNVVAAVEKGVPIAYKKPMKTADLIPNYDPDDPESHSFLFMPIYHKDLTYGYTVYKDSMILLEDRIIYQWNNRLMNVLEHSRQTLKVDVMNRQLLELYTRDSLTGLYNRFGQERIMVPMYRDMMQYDQLGAIVFVDINNMKVVNDVYGHLQGDFAIRTVADAITDAIPLHWIALRYGGDEFLLFGTCEGEQVVRDIMDEVDVQLKKRLLRMSVPYELSVSQGYQMVEASLDMSLAEYIKKADEKMYVVKQNYHKEHDI